MLFFSLWFLFCWFNFPFFLLKMKLTADLKWVINNMLELYKSPARAANSRGFRSDLITHTCFFPKPQLLEPLFSPFHLQRGAENTCWEVLGFGR